MLNPLCTWAALGTGCLCLTRRYLWLFLSGGERRPLRDHGHIGGGQGRGGEAIMQRSHRRQKGEPQAKINGEKVKNNQLSFSREYPRRHIFIFVLWLLHVNIFVSGQKKGEVKSQTAQTLIFPLAAHTDWPGLSRMKRRRFYPSWLPRFAPQSWRRKNQWK